MLFLVFGASASGKTTALSALRDLPGVASHDFDEIGVPADADTAWRHRANEDWLLRGIAYEQEGIDLVLASQTPLGELIATPRAASIEIAGCLLDCDDATRLARLHARGAQWLARVPGDLHAHMHWAEWMRGHARDPLWRLDVVQHEATASYMDWSRVRADDPRWPVPVVDTGASSPAQVGDTLRAWIAGARGR